MSTIDMGTWDYDKIQESLPIDKSLMTRVTENSVSTIEFYRLFLT